MKNFIKSLERSDNKTLIEAILEGYTVIFENNEVAYLVAQARKFKTVDDFLKAQKGIKIGNCVDDSCVDDIFGSVSEFARQVEEEGDNFLYGDINVKYNPKTDIHTFYEVDKSKIIDIWNKAHKPKTGNAINESSFVDEHKPEWWYEPTDNVFAPKGMTKGDVIIDWLKRHKVKTEGGKYIFYHATPIKGGAKDMIRKDSYLATDKETAIHQAGRDRDLKPKEIRTIVVRLNPEELHVGPWATLRNDYYVDDGIDKSAHGINESADNNNEYYYHETKKDHIKDIQNDGLLPTSYGQSLVNENTHELMSPDDLSEEELENIPEEDTLPRTYFSIEEQQRPTYGDGIFLRFPKNAITHIDTDIDYYTFDSIPPEKLEIKTENGWKNITDVDL